MPSWTDAPFRKRVAVSPLHRPETLFQYLVLTLKETQIDLSKLGLTFEEKRTDLPLPVLIFKSSFLSSPECSNILILLFCIVVANLLLFGYVLRQSSSEVRLPFLFFSDSARLVR